MEKYIVIEIQNGAALVWTYDSRAEAESKYHAVLSFAAVSAVEIHSAVILTSTGHLLAAQCYDHRPEPEPEEETPAEQ